MFFPMSWTSPFTVATTILGFAVLASDSVVFMYGWRISTASLITLADFTTCGRNILPSPKSFPTVSMPSMSGPSMILTALPYSAIASSRSWWRVSVRPLTRDVFRRVGRSPIESWMTCEWSGVGSVLPAASSFILEALSISRSVAFGSVSKITSSTHLRSSGSMSSYIWSIDGLTIAMSMPALIAWYRNAECIASRTALLPLNANERLDTPPEVNAPGRFVLIHRTASMKSTAYLACSSMPVPTESMFTSNMMSCGVTPASSVRSLYALPHISILRSYVVA